MPLKLDISDLSSHADAAKALLDFAGTERILVFEAPMGAGKTTFIKSVCKVLGVIDTMSSPTYSIVNEYRTDSGDKLFHFDLYRLKSSDELMDMGFEEYLSLNHYVFIEWPELAFPFIDSYVKVSIEASKNIRYLYAEIISSL